MTNPFYSITTDSFEILVSDSGQRLVCTTSDQGPKFTSTPGDMLVEKLSTEITTEINNVDSVTF